MKKKICLVLMLSLLFSVFGQKNEARADWQCSLEKMIGVTPAVCDSSVTCGNYPPQIVITNKSNYRQIVYWVKTCVNNQGEVQDFVRNESVVLGCCD